MAKLEKVEIDGEVSYINPLTGDTMVKLSKEEFREKMLKDRNMKDERVRDLDKRALQQWQDEQQKQHEKDNAHVKGLATKGEGNKARNSFLDDFTNNLTKSNIKTISTGKTSLGLDFNGSHYELKIAKKNKPIENFENLPGKVDKVKDDIINIILAGIEEKTVVIKNEAFIRTSENDFQVKLVKKKDDIEGL